MSAAGAAEADTPPPSFITVVVPTCHRNDTLALCLDRLAPGAQMLPADRYEVIVCDDGRKTTAKEMLAERYPWARWYPGPAKGPGPNRNVGVREARGEFIAFVDDDCVPSAEWLAGFVSGLTHDIDVYEGKTVCEGGMRSPLEEAPVNEKGGALWSCNLMVRRGTFLEMGGFDEELHVHEDLDLRLRLQRAGRAHRFVPAAVVNHPPRPIRRGGRNHNFHHDLAAVWYKSGQRSPVGIRLMRFIFKERLLRLREFPMSPQYIPALTSLAGELWHIARHVGEWEQEFRQRYEGREPAYPFPYPHF